MDAGAVYRWKIRVSVSENEGELSAGEDNGFSAIATAERVSDRAQRPEVCLRTAPVLDDVDIGTVDTIQFVRLRLHDLYPGQMAEQTGFNGKTRAENRHPLEALGTHGARDFIDEVDNWKRRSRKQERNADMRRDRGDRR